MRRIMLGGLLLMATMPVLPHAANAQMALPGNAGGDGITVSGESAGRGVTCLQFRTGTGETISLSGNTDQLRQPGTRARLTGHWQRMSTCQQGKTLFVEQVELLDK